MPSLIQRSFAAGEVAPALYGRADQVKYQTGLRRCRNMIVRRHGGVSNRPGLGYIRTQKDSSARARQWKFVFNDDQTYVLIFENLCMRITKDGAPLTVSGVAAYNGATAYVIGDLVVSATVNYYCIAATTGNAPPNATYWYALTGSIYEIPTPYVTADLQTLYFAQSGDVITIAHQSYAPRNLSRTGHTTWVLTTEAFALGLAAPAGLAGTAGGAGTAVYRYTVTAIAEDTLEESVAAKQAAKTIIGATQANPCVVQTSAAHSYSIDDVVYISGISGMTQLNGRYLRITALPAADTFTLGNVNSTAYGAWTAGGTAERVSVTFTGATPTEAAPHVITWTEVSGAVEYDVYKEVSAGSNEYGYIGTATTNKFSDTNIAADGTIVPIVERNPFGSVGNYPASVGYYQQRRYYANTANDTELVEGSRIALFSNFTKSEPLQDDDAVSFSMIGRQVNAVRHMVDLDDFVVLTSGAAYIVEGDADGAITPQSSHPRAKVYHGASEVQPVIIGNSLLYVQARGSILRDFRKDLVEGPKSKDLSIYSAHLFEGLDLEHMDYAETPNSIAWIQRDDGVWLGLTYLLDHDVQGWHRHDTDGDIEDVIVVPEGSEDVLYVLVKRTINGSTKRYQERLTSRFVSDQAVDAIFMDSFLTFDGRNTGATTMTLSGGVDWLATEDLTLTASAGFFVAGDVGNDIILYVRSTARDTETGLTTTTITATVTLSIIGYTGATIVTVNANKTVPAALRNVAVTDWARAVDELTGLDHLEGKSVAVLGDGLVVANGVDETTYTVTAGVVTLQQPYGVIHVGLPYYSDIELLDLEMVGQETLADKQKLVKSVSLLVEDSRGFFAGPDAEHLEEYNPGEEGTDPETGIVEINIPCSWSTSGRVFVRVKDPVPVTILTAIPNGEIGG